MVLYDEIPDHQSPTQPILGKGWVKLGKSLE